MLLHASIAHEIYSRYGLEPFESATSIAAHAHEILFYFLHRRMSRKPEQYKECSAIRGLLKKWDCLTLYGCANPDCTEQDELLRLRELRKRGVRNPVVEERLYRWGGESKACTACRAASYCSSACQRAHWRSHKPECQKKTALEKTEMEVEV